MKHIKRHENRRVNECTMFEFIGDMERFENKRR